MWFEGSEGQSGREQKWHVSERQAVLFMRQSNEVLRKGRSKKVSMKLEGLLLLQYVRDVHIYIFWPSCTQMAI